jgi:hypothetical protein
MDLDPWICIMELRIWIQIRILLFYSDANKKNFLPSFFAYKLPKEHLHPSSKTKCYKEVREKKKQRFSFFSLVIEGSRSEQLITDPGDLKNRIRNTVFLV